VTWESAVVDDQIVNDPRLKRELRQYQTDWQQLVVKEHHHMEIEWRCKQVVEQLSEVGEELRDEDQLLR